MDNIPNNNQYNNPNFPAQEPLAPQNENLGEDAGNRAFENRASENRVPENRGQEIPNGNNFPNSSAFQGSEPQNNPPQTSTTALQGEYREVNANNLEGNRDGSFPQNHNNNFNNSFNGNAREPYNSRGGNGSFNGGNYQRPPMPAYTPQSVTPPMPNGNFSNNNMSPSDIYRTQCAPQGNMNPQYHYGAPMGSGFIDNNYYQKHQEYLRKKKLEEKHLRRTGNISGALLLGSLIFANLFSIIFLVPGLSELYNSSVSVNSFVNMVYSIIVVGLSFALFGMLYSAKAHSSIKPAGTIADKGKPFGINFDAPKGALKTFLLILICFGGCIAANYITTFIMSFFQSFGINSTYSAIQYPESIEDIVIMVIAAAVIPPLIEEFAFRGIVLSSLRKYGDIFAIIASAFMFGIFHGNATQIPFAFLCGLLLGYITIATDSIWPAIILHALNNSLSCISSVIISKIDEAAGSIFFSVSSAVIIIAALVALFFFSRLYSKSFRCLKKNKQKTTLTEGKKFGTFISSPLMIVAIIFYLYLAYKTLEF